jgi:hypothetical protein
MVSESMVPASSNCMAPAMPSSWHLLPDTVCLAADDKCLAPGAWHLESRMNVDSKTLSEYYFTCAAITNPVVARLSLWLSGHLRCALAKELEPNN